MLQVCKRRNMHNSSLCVYARDMLSFHYSMHKLCGINHGSNTYFFLLNCHAQTMYCESVHLRLPNITVTIPLSYVCHGLFLPGYRKFPLGQSSGHTIRTQQSILIIFLRRQNKILLRLVELMVNKN
jgi:hypothetical protein